MEAAIKKKKVQNSILSRVGLSDLLRRSLSRLCLTSEENLPNQKPTLVGSLALDAEAPSEDWDLTPDILAQIFETTTLNIPKHSQKFSPTYDFAPNQFIPLSDLPPVEAALSIEKIRNSLFSLLEPQDLLRCRLVSSSWLRMATTGKLLKQNKNSIELRFTGVSDTPKYVTVKGIGRTLPDVTNVLDGLGSHPLPWSARVILEMDIAQMDHVEFFDRYGFVVSSLKLIYLDMQKFPCGGSFRSDSLLEFLTKLLTEKLHNLESLRVDFRTMTFVGEIEPQLLDRIKNGSYSAGKQNQSLSFIEIKGNIPSEIIDALCCLAPRLEELLVFHSWGIYKHRLHLLQKLNFVPELEHWDDVVALEFILDTAENLNLKWFFADLLNFRERLDLLPRLCTLVTKILEKSCQSLEKLVIGRIYFLPGIVLPQMLKVKGLTFEKSNHDMKSEHSYWPQGTSIADTFPALLKINFIGYKTISHFLSLCKNEEVTSVEMIEHDRHFDEVHCEPLFPNAVVSVKNQIYTMNLYYLTRDRGLPQWSRKNFGLP